MVKSSQMVTVESELRRSSRRSELTRLTQGFLKDVGYCDVRRTGSSRVSEIRKLTPGDVKE